MNASAPSTAIVGDLSGLQSFIFTLSEGEGGHAKCLRARSFYIQILAECCAMQFIEAAQWPRESLVFCGAAKFVLLAKRDADRTRLVSAGNKINKWLLGNLGGQLFFAWASASGEHNETMLWGKATTNLQAEKLRPWAGVVQGADGWDARKLVLPKVDLDSHNRPKVPDASVFEDRKIGGRLPASRWLEIGTELEDADFNVLDYSCKLHKSYPGDASRASRLYALGNEQAPAGQPQPETRYLARHIPTHRNNSPLTFEEIANSKHVRGDELLGVLKMDADSLGVAFERLQNLAGGVLAVPDLSKRLDWFFSVTLDEEKRKDAEWDSIYTVFSGGDDLLAVGPWNIAFDYADHVRTLFDKEFGKVGLTISAGLAIVKPKFPIQRAAEYAEELLDLAKKQGKNRFATFGQVWPWVDHATVISNADRLARWVEAKAIQRGWLEEILQFAEAAARTDRFRIDVKGLSGGEIAARNRANLLATARLAYQTGRKYKDPRNRWEFNRWIKSEIADLEDQNQRATRYLPAIMRYAIAATRSPVQQTNKQAYVTIS